MACQNVVIWFSQLYARHIIDIIGSATRIEAEALLFGVLRKAPLELWHPVSGESSQTSG